MQRHRVTAFNARKRTSWILLTAAALLLPAPRAGAADWIQQVDALFEQWDRDDTPGCAIAVVHDGEIVYAKGYGSANLRYGIPMTPTTVLRAGSNSKQFAAFCILLLEEEGKLSLSDDVRLHVPEVPDFGPTITIEHLIYHISGLRDFLQLMAYGGWNFHTDLVSNAQALALVERQKKLNFEPGDQFMYCNTGYMLLAQIVARVSGQTFPEFAKERIFEPLGMSQSHFPDDVYGIVEDFADSYFPIGDGKYLYFPLNHSSAAAGGLHTTVEDLAKWDQNFYDPIVGNHALLDRMHETAYLNSGEESPFSMGLIVANYQGRRFVYHGGDLAGFHANLVRFPDEHLSIITMANTAELASNVLAEKSIQAADYFFGAVETSVGDYLLHDPSLAGEGIGGVKLYAPDLDSLHLPLELRQSKDGAPIEKPVTPAFEPDSEYLGRYYSEELDVFYTVSLNDQGNLLFQTLRRQPYLFHVTRTRADRMIVPGSGGLGGDFYRNADGRVIGFRLGDSRVIDLDFRKVEIVPVD